VIQGLRCLPFTADLPIFNCSTCQNGDPKMRIEPQPLIVRQRQACGFLPYDPSVRVPWGLPEGVDFTPGEGEPDSEDFVPICPGYLTSLPEVQEAVRLRPHWLKGAAHLLLKGCEDPEPALTAQAVLDGAVVTKQNFDAEKRAREAEEARRRGG
jgi:hypothetical protein